MSFIDFLPWNDILFEHIFPRLSILDHFRIRSLNVKSKDCIDEYFSKNKKLDLTYLTNISPMTFHLLTKNNTTFRILILTNCSGWLNDNLFIPIINQCKLIEYIDISSCNLLTDRTVEALVKNSNRLKVRWKK